MARATKPAHTPAAGAKSAHKTKGEKADAENLLNDGSKALAAMVKAARADKGLDPKAAKNKPFWKSTQLIAKNLKTAKSGLAAKNDDFFKGIAEARKAEEQMKVDWQLTDSKNTGVVENGKKLGHAIELLRTNYSKEAARKKKGGELTAKEKAEFEKIKAQQKDLLAKISKLQKSAQKDKALAKGLNEIQKQAERITRQPATLDAYIATLYLLDLQAGLIRSYEYYVDKSWRGDTTLGIVHGTILFLTIGNQSTRLLISTKTSPFLNRFRRRKLVQKNPMPRMNPSTCLTPNRRKSLPKKTLTKKSPPTMMRAWRTPRTTKAKTWATMIAAMPATKILPMMTAVTTVEMMKAIS